MTTRARPRLRRRGRTRLRLRGAAASADQRIRRRIANVAAGAGLTRPEREVISVCVEGEDLEVMTTAEELAHRIVHELQKAFGGRAAYAWSDCDGSLRAVWEMPARTRERRA
jgi:hypothetical protein